MALNRVLPASFSREILLAAAIFKNSLPSWTRATALFAAGTDWKTSNSWQNALRAPNEARTSLFTRQMTMLPGKTVSAAKWRDSLATVNSHVRQWGSGRPRYSAATGPSETKSRFRRASVSAGPARVVV